MSRKSYSCY